MDKRTGIFSLMPQAIKPYVIALLVTLLSGFSTKLWAANDKPLQAAARHRPPWITVNDAQIGGPLYDIAVEAAERAGIRLTWQIEPFARSLASIQSGHDTLLPRMAKNVERSAYALFTISVHNTERRVVFAVPSDKALTVKRYADLYGKTIGVKRKGSYFEKFDQDEGLLKHWVKDDVQLVRMLDAGRLDIAATPDPLAFEEAADLHQAHNWHYVDYQYRYNTGIYYGFAKGSVYFDAFNQALIEMRQDGSLLAIFKHHQLVPKPVSD